MFVDTKKRKFTAIICLLSVPILLFGWLFISQSLKDIAFAQSELRGTEALGHAVAALQQIVTNESATASLLDLEDEKWSDLAIKPEIKDLKNAIESDVADPQAKVAAAQALIAAIGDQSKLILDPDLDSYYTMDIVVLRVPELLGLLATLDTQPINSDSRLSATNMQADMAHASTGLVSAMKGFQNSVHRAIDNNRDGGTRSALANSFQSLSEQVEAFITLAQIAPGASASGRQFIFRDRASSHDAIVNIERASSRFWNIANGELRRLLEKRIASLQTRLYIALTIAGLVGLTAMIIAFSFFQGMLSRLDEEIIFLAHHDPLTRLANRVSLSDEIDKAIESTKASSIPCAIHLIDLDRFKAINDSLGHAAGDEVIRIMAARLKTLLGKHDTVGRLGGDELVVLQRHVPTTVSAQVFAERIVKTMREPFVCGDHTVQTSASVGVALAPLHGDNQSSILVSADLALYAAKNTGRDRYHFFTPELEQETKNRIAIEAEIRRAIAQESFDIEFQPQYDVSGSELRGFEALLRLSDQSGNRISPAVFIPIAEQIGLISTIGVDVLERACAFAATWPNQLTLAVNLSPAQFRDGGLPGAIALALAKAKLDSSRLTVEITEGLLLESTPQVLQQIDEIRSMGVRIAIDDFGTGYSNLAYLANHRFDKIKIDRSLIKGINSEQSSIKEVIRTIINLGRSMNMVVVAEGVETQEQATAMLDMDCHEIQGFLYGRPQPVTEVANTILRSREIVKKMPISRQPDFLELFKSG